MKIDAIVEGGILRAVYVDGALVDFDVFDFDTEGQSAGELRELLDRIDSSPRGSKLHTDLLTWRADVSDALSYVEGATA